MIHGTPYIAPLGSVMAIEVFCSPIIHWPSTGHPLAIHWPLAMAVGQLSHFGNIGHHLIVAIIDHIPNGWVMFNGDIL